MRFQDLTGNRYSHLTVIHRVFDPNRKGVYWLCRCDCGKEKVVSADNLRSGKVKSCGCIRGNNLKTHGLSGLRLHRIWKAMKTRCLNPNSANYKYYGGRGISICDEWLNDFEQFYQWAMQNGYTDDMTIDRINSNGNYSSDNCRWISMPEQNLNRRSNRFIEYNGESKTIKEWADIYGINYKTLRNRLLVLGWNFTDAIKKAKVG